MAALSPWQKAWQRWRRFAHRAAVVQSHVLLFLLYVLVVVPVASVGKLFGTGRAVLRSAGWREIERPPDDLDSAHRQF